MHPNRLPNSLKNSDLTQLPVDDHRVHREELLPKLYPLREGDVAYMRARYLQVLSIKSESVREAGRRLFHQVANQHWSVEWNLPRWLGGEVGLSEKQQSALLAVNVFGLGYARMFDDRQDGEAWLVDVKQARSLEIALLQAAQSELHQLVGENPDFWDPHNAIMERWHGAGEIKEASVPVLEMGSDQLAQIADMGAPLMITAAACTVLQSQTFMLEELQKPIRHYLIAAVLYDHLKDWQMDLEAGRHNLFVHAITGSAPYSDEQVDVRFDVYRALIEGDTVQAYIDLVIHQLACGIESAVGIGLYPMAKHLAALAQQASDSSRQSMEDIQEHLKRGIALFNSAH